MRLYCWQARPSQPNSEPVNSHSRIRDKAEAAFQGRRGAALCLVDATDGKSVAQYKLESSPVFDGMIAARGRIFLSWRTVHSSASARSSSALGQRSSDRQKARPMLAVKGSSGVALRRVSGQDSTVHIRCVT